MKKSAPTGRPVKPDGLGDVASAKWDQVIKHLEKESQLAPAYGDFIEMYCKAFQDLHDAESRLEIDGEYCQGEKGGVYQHPAVGVKNKAIERILKFGRQLGMSGASAPHVQKTEKKEETTKKRFFGKQA